MAFGKPRTPLTPEEQLQRRQNLGVGLSALSETLKGGDPVGRTLGLQQQFEQQAQQAEQEAQEQRMLASMTPEQRQIYNMQKRWLPESYIKSKLYPTQENKDIVIALNAIGADVGFVEIESDKGHDSFLLDVPEFLNALKNFLEKSYTNN